MVREFFIDNLLVRTHFIIEMICWTGLTPWEFEFPFPGSRVSTFLWRCGRINPGNNPVLEQDLQCNHFTITDAIQR